MEEGATSQSTRVPLGAGKSTIKDSPLEPPEGAMPGGPPELRDGKSVLFPASTLVVICYSSNRELIREALPRRPAAAGVKLWCRREVRGEFLQPGQAESKPMNRGQRGVFSL